MNRRSDQRGQGTVEYVGALLLLSAVFAVVLASGADLPGAALGRTVVSRLLCSAGVEGSCDPRRSGLVLAYGEEVGEAVLANRPDIRFEPAAYSSLPVDFRRCRERRCADTIRTGTVGHSQRDEQPTALVHVVDCRSGSETPGADCEGAAAGNLYIQYWLYYPDSATRTFGRAGFHIDDWESYQVRIGADGSADARASSHHGYNYSGGITAVLSDSGLLGRPGWGPSIRSLWVSDGSHAGRVTGGSAAIRAVVADQLRVRALDGQGDELDGYRFSISPPWQKAVWTDPENEGT